MLTQVEELPENRVRLNVEVPRDEMKHAVEHAAGDLASSVKVPGFRKGKVPRQVLLARMGRERVMAEAVESHIGGWFRSAAASSRILPISKPEYAYELPETDDQTFSFTATVSVQPKPEPPDWTVLEVPYIEPEVPAELVEGELDELRRSVAPLERVDSRPAKEDDVAIVDLVGPAGEARRDYVVEIGDQRFIDEVNEALVAMVPGQTKAVDYEDENGNGRLEVTVREIHERALPALDDELARASSEFDTLADLRADIERELREQIEDEVETRFRAAAADTLVEAAGFEASGPLVDARTRELLLALERSLERRGISLDTYVAVSGEDPRAFVDRLRAQAAHAVSRELVLEAVADRLNIQISDEDLRAHIHEQAEAVGEDDPDGVTERILGSAAAEQLRGDLRLRAALDRVTAEVKRIPAELARARELWTPGQEKGPTDTKLWTPATNKEPA